MTFYLSFSIVTKSSVFPETYASAVNVDNGAVVGTSMAAVLLTLTIIAGGAFAYYRLVCLIRCITNGTLWKKNHPSGLFGV